MMRFAPFFLLISAQIGPFRPIPADIGRYGRYGPSRPDLGRVGADFSRVGPIRDSPRGTTRHGRAVCGVPPASPRPAASDASALAWEPRPCIPVYKCFEARYFPRTSILEASKSPNCSFVWRSLMAALYILRFGHCWRVGDGLSINVYWDRWIPKYPTNRPFLSVRDDEEEVWVSSLINQDLHVWCRDVIMASFTREEGEAICDIPLSRRDRKSVV